MKIVWILGLFSILVIKSSAIYSNIFLQYPINDDNSAHLLCQNLKNTLDLDKGTHDILLTRIDSNVTDSMINDLSRCLGADYPIIVKNSTKLVVNSGLRKVQLMIVEGSTVEMDTTVWNFKANMLYISHSTIPSQQIAKILFRTSQAGFLNVALMHKVNEKFVVNYADTIMTKPDIKEVRTLSGPEQNIFPDKLKNSKGFPIHIPVINQPPILEVRSGQVVNKMVKFVEILEEKMNAVAKYHLTQNPKEFQDFINRQKFHLVLNRFRAPLDIPKVPTYEENGFCSMVPKPPRIRVAELIFVKPFDRFVWMFLSLTVVACLVVWRLFLNRGTSDSFWLLLFGMFAMFVGQGVEFRRTHRVVLVILLQLIVSMIFVLSNGYQGVITSFMIQPESEQRFKTVKELLESETRISVSDYFFEIVKDSKDFQAIISKLDIIAVRLLTGKGILDKLIDEKSTIIVQCEFIKYLMESEEAVRQNYYKVPQKIVAVHDYLTAGYQNPFLQRFQRLMDLSFEAGLPQAWSLFYERNLQDDAQPSYELQNLGLNDLSQIFYFLIFGHLCAVLTCLVEIFFQSFIDKLDLSNYTLKLRNFFNNSDKLKSRKLVGPTHRKNVPNTAKKCCKKAKRPKVEKPKVRRVMVQPVNSLV